MNPSITVILSLAQKRRTQKVGEEAVTVNNQLFPLPEAQNTSCADNHSGWNEFRETANILAVRKIH